MHLRHVLEQFLDLARFPAQLLLVIEVLVLAAAALAEERAFGLQSVSRCFNDLKEIGLTVRCVVAIDTSPDFFTRQGVWHKDNPPFLLLFLSGELHPGNADTEVTQSGNFQFDFLVVIKRVGVEFFRFAHGKPEHLILVETQGLPEEAGPAGGLIEMLGWALFGSTRGCVWDVSVPSAI